MGNVLDDLAVYIYAQSTVWTIGNKLVKGRLPDTPDTCVALIEVLGFEPPINVFSASNVYHWERPQVQIISRAGRDDYQTARTNAETIYKMLRNVYQTTSGINGTKYHWIAIRSSPHYQGEDDNSRHHITFTVDCWKNKSS